MMMQVPAKDRVNQIKDGFVAPLLEPVPRAEAEPEPEGAPFSPPACAGRRPQPRDEPETEYEDDDSVSSARSTPSSVAEIADSALLKSEQLLKDFAGMGLLRVDLAEVQRSRTAALGQIPTALGALRGLRVGTTEGEECSAADRVCDEIRQRVLRAELDARVEFVERLCGEMRAIQSDLLARRAEMHDQHLSR